MAQCKAKTKKRVQCKLPAKKGLRGYCAIHATKIAPRRISWGKIFKYGAGTIYGVGAINDIYEFAEKQWPNLKLAAKVIKEIIAGSGTVGPRPKRNPDGSIQRNPDGSIRWRTIPVTMANFQYTCRRIIERGQVAESEAKIIYDDFNLWFSTLPAEVRLGIYQQFINRKTRAQDLSEVSEGKSSST